MGLPIGLNSVTLRAFITFPFLLAMFSGEVFLDAGQIAQGSTRVVVHAAGLWANIHFLLYYF